MNLTNRPLPDLYLAYREKTGCKQYVFFSYSDMRKYFDKKCYKGEQVKYNGYRNLGNGEFGESIFFIDTIFKC